MLIVDIFKKYCKSEFTKDGYTLSFIDNSALSELSEEQANRLKREKIRLVVNNFVLYELVKGLDKESKGYSSLCKKKLQIMEYLDIPGCLFLPYHENIEEMELSYVSDVSNKTDNACDRLPIFQTSPYSKLELTVKEYSYKEYLKNLMLQDEGNIKEIIEEGLNNIVKSGNQLKAIYKILCNRCEPKITTFINQEILCTRLKQGNNSIDEKRVTYVANLFSSEGEQFYNQAPYYYLSTLMLIDRCKNSEQVQNKDKNDLMDEMHFISSISYCDYFLSLDQKHIKIIDNFFKQTPEFVPKKSARKL